jgi:prepilin-type N-terminal cleavage/methylation domain-containing protein
MSKAIARDYRPGTPAENRSNMIKFTKRSRRAFSLVEILFAVIIIGVLTAVAVPSLFNNKGKADDSNAKQTLRAAYTLISTSLDDSGALQGNPSGVPNGGELRDFLKKVDKNLTFAAAPSLTGNVRTIGLDTDGTVVKIVAVGGKTEGGYNCFAINYDITGSNATIFSKKINNGSAPSFGCDVSAAVTWDGTGTIQNGSAVGDFPLK